MTFDLELRQKKVEDYRKKAIERRKNMLKDTKDTSNKNSRSNSPEFGVNKERSSKLLASDNLRRNEALPNIMKTNMKEPQNGCNKKRVSGIRIDFPKQLINEFPFLDSPKEINEDVAPLFTLFDLNCKKTDTHNAIGQMIMKK